MVKVLFICTSNKDRSPALAKYFSEAFDGFECKSAGINRYFCNKKGTHLVTIEDLMWANLVVYAEDIHKRVTENMFEPSYVHHNSLILNCGEYKQGHIGDDYIAKVEEKMMKKIGTLLKLGE